MDLAGLEGWLRLGSSEVSATSSTISVKHQKRDDIVYNVEGGKIALKFHVQGSGLSHGGKSTGLSDGRRSYVEIRDKASLIYIPSSSLGLTDMQKNSCGSMIFSPSSPTRNII